MILARRGPRPLIYLPSNFLPCGPAPCTISFRSVPFNARGRVTLSPGRGQQHTPPIPKTKTLPDSSNRPPQGPGCHTRRLCEPGRQTTPSGGKTPYRALQGHCRACQRSDTPPGTPHGIVPHILGMVRYMIVYVNRIQLTFHYGTYSQKQGFRALAATPDFFVKRLFELWAHTTCATRQYWQIEQG